MKFGTPQWNILLTPMILDITDLGFYSGKKLMAEVAITSTFRQIQVDPFNFVSCVYGTCNYYIPTVFVLACNYTHYK